MYRCRSTTLRKFRPIQEIGGMWGPCMNRGAEENDAGPLFRNKTYESIFSNTVSYE